MRIQKNRGDTSAQSRRDPVTENLVRRIGAVSHSSRIHSVHNRAIARLLDWLVSDLNAVLATKGECRLELDGGYAFVNGAPVRSSRELRGQVSAFYRDIKQHDIGGFRLRGPAGKAGLIALLEGIGEEGLEREEFQKRIEARGVRELELLPVRKIMSGTLAGTGSSVRVAASESLRAYVRTVTAVEAALKDGNMEKIPAPLYKGVQDLADLAIDEPAHHLALTSLKEEIDAGIRHPVNVAILSMALARRIGLDRAALVELGFAALMAAALSSGRSDEERLQAAARVLHVPKVTPARARRMLVIYQHGLPRWQGLHLYARICAIATSYDRLTTRSANTGADTGADTGDNPPAGLLPDEALARMQEENTFDPELMARFTQVVGRYPLGTVVRLSSQEIAVVYHTAADPALADRPVVRVLRDRDGRPTDRVIDLAADSRTIAAVIDRDLAGLEDSLDFFR